MEILEMFMNMQTAAMKYKTKEPLLLRRRATSLSRFRSMGIGEELALWGFTSTFATEEAYNHPKVVEFLGKAEIEFRVPVGVYCVPIGEEAMSWKELDDIVLPHGTRVRVLQLQITGDSPSLILEVFPTAIQVADVEQYITYAERVADIVGEDNEGIGVTDIRKSRFALPIIFSDPIFPRAVSE